MDDVHGDLRDWLVRRPIAHRGLHDGNVAICENSLAAARAAIAGGYAIECDVLISEDGVPVVFHDDTLDRLTQASGRLADWSMEELRTLALGNGQAQIPMVQEFLATVAGQVPIVMELKGTSPQADAGYMDALLPVISGYSGLLALMSFDEWLIDQAIEAAVFPVGLTAEGKDAETLTRHRAVYERGCRFASYNLHHLPNAFTDWVRAAKGDPVISWTVRTAAEAERSVLCADQITFEGFVPRH